MHDTLENMSLGSVPENEHLAMSWLLPFHFFYERRDLEIPDLQFIDGDDMPDGFVPENAGCFFAALARKCVQV